MNEPENSGVSAVENTKYDNIVTTIDAEEPRESPKEAELVQEVKEDEPQQDGDKAKEKKGGFTRKLAAKDAIIADLQAKLETNQPKAQQPANSERPRLEDFETYEQHAEALTDWKVEQKFQEKDTKSKEENLRNEMKQRTETYVAKANEFAKEHPDFDEVIAECESFTPLMVQAIQDSDLGPEVAYYLANNPEEAEKLTGMGIVAMNRALGRIESKLESSKETKATVRTTNAPPPIKPLTKNASTTVDPYNTNMEADDYAKWRRQRKS